MRKVAKSKQRKIFCYMNKMQKGGVQWSRMHTAALINAYQAHPCLWDVKHPDYRDKDTRNAAIEVMTEFLSDYIPNITIDDVKHKINSLRSQHRKEVFTVANNIREQRLWYWDMMKFLLPNTIVTPIESEDGKKTSPEREYIIQWDRPTTIQLIKLFRPMRCLWDGNDEDYNNIASRDSALRALADQMRRYLHRITVEDVKAKLQYLTSQYKKELRNLMEARRKGDIHVYPKFWAFKHLDFLRPLDYDTSTTVHNTEMVLMEEHLIDKHNYLLSQNEMDSKDEQSGCSHSKKINAFEEPYDPIECDDSLMTKPLFKTEINIDSPQIVQAVPVEIKKQTSNRSTKTATVAAAKAAENAIQKRTSPNDSSANSSNQSYTARLAQRMKNEKLRYKWLGEQIVATLNDMQDEDIIDETISSMQQLINEAKAKDRKALRTNTEDENTS